MSKTCKIVLVRPQFAGNIGSTARVMKNMGFSELILVSPKANHLDDEAKKFSCQGEEILHNATQVNSIAQALSGCTFVAATSSQTKGLTRSALTKTIRCAAKDLSKEINRSQIALIFGPESSGLTTEEISYCNLLISIPTSNAYPALNLAMSVAITLYEINMALEEKGENRAKPIELASWEMQQQAFGALRSSLEEIHFLFGPKAEGLFNGIKHMISRANPTTQEMKWLIGLNRQLQWYKAKTKDQS